MSAIFVLRMTFLSSVKLVELGGRMVELLDKVITWF